MGVLHVAARPTDAAIGHSESAGLGERLARIRDGHSVLPIGLEVGYADASRAGAPRDGQATHVGSARESRSGSANGSAVCSPLLGAARLCSLLLDSDLGRWDEPQVGGVVVTILTSEGSLVRTQLRPPESPGQAASLGQSGRLS